MLIVEFSNYKTFLKAEIEKRPGHGRGQARKLADYLNVQPMVLSHILTRDRHFTQGQALGTADYFKLSALEREYFLYMVNIERADTKPLKDFYESKLAKVGAEIKNVKNHVAGREQLSELDKGVFYSNWYYCGISLLASIKGYQSVDAISNYFGISRSRVDEIISFLVTTGLCIEKDGLIGMGTKSTHVDNKSAFVNGHRRNWRQKAIEKFTEPGAGDLFFSGPVSLSNADAEQFRIDLLKFINSFSKKVENSPEENLRCLNIDWFEF